VLSAVVRLLLVPLEARLPVTRLGLLALLAQSLPNRCSSNTLFRM
jgi:hypothetical protein